MGLLIEATGVSLDPSVTSSITHAVIAGKDCISRAGTSPLDVDLLINVGVFRDSNMVEPAMAALIQRDLGVSLDYPKNAAFNPTFSFDLMNGACGVLNAVQAGGASLLLGEAKRVLIVSSDVHPSNRDNPDFPYARVGAAMLLTLSEGSQGFGRVEASLFPGLLGTEAFVPLGRGRTDGRESITIQRDDDYARRLLDFAEDSARKYAQAEGIELEKTMLVTSQPTRTFASDLAQRLGAKAHAPLPNVEGDPHTSALTLAYHAAAEAGLLRGCERLLFVAAGAGLSSMCAEYRR
jgi:3-oxoacyl-[acyl-carrier-protein] synthase-3